MSAVDDVEARIRRLDELRAAKLAQLHQLQHELCYNSVAGVDEHRRSGQSVAQLDVTIEAARHVVFKTGFLSSPHTYVRATLVLVVAQHQQSHCHAQQTQQPQQTLMEQQRTSKRLVTPAPHWRETLVFKTLPAAVGTLRVDVMQEERIGADDVVGTFLVPLSKLQDQRPLDKWHVLQQTRDGRRTSEVFVSCRLQRSPLSALSVELELLQNQTNELHVFLGRHQHLVTGRPPDALLPSSPSRRAGASAHALQGTVVAPDETRERGSESRFSAVASFPPAMKKREWVATDATDDGRGLLEALRAKRQRVHAEQQPPAGSLSDRLANWLLPAATPRTAMKAADAPADAASSQVVFPFTKHRPRASEGRRGRRTGRSHLAAEAKRPATALQAIEKWLFTTEESGQSGGGAARQQLGTR